VIIYWFYAENCIFVHDLTSFPVTSPPSGTHASPQSGGDRTIAGVNHYFSTFSSALSKSECGWEGSSDLDQLSPSATTELLAIFNHKACCLTQVANNCSALFVIREIL